MKRLQSFLLIIALLFSIVFVQPATLSLAATTNVQDVQSVYSKAVSQYSYNEAFLDSEIERAMKNR
jgi:hypothetical protein